MLRPSQIADQERIEDEDYFDDDDTWETEIDDREEIPNDFDTGDSPEN